MNSALLREVTSEEKKQFLRDGVVCLRDIVAPQWLQVAREGIEDQRRSPSPCATIVDRDPLYLLIDQFPSQGNEKLRRVVFESGTGDIAKQLLGVQQMHHLYDQLFYKGAGPVAETPWHQDTAYGWTDGLNIIRIWMPVDHVPRETTLEVVRGSHLWNVEYDVIESVKVLEDNKESTTTSKFNYLDKQADNRPKLPNIEAHREAFDILGYEVNPGDVVVFNYHILHHAGAGVNPNDKRRAFAILYADESITLKHRPNTVPGPLESAGRVYEDGQTLAAYPDVFQRV